MEYGKRKPMLKRKPGVVIAIGMPKPDLKERVAEQMDKEPEAEDSLICPKCGMELADTPENRAYAKKRAEDMDESDDEDIESDDDDEMDED